MPSAMCLGGVPGGHDVGDAQAEGAVLGEVAEFLKQRCVGELLFIRVGHRRRVAWPAPRSIWVPGLALSHGSAGGRIKSGISGSHRLIQTLGLGRECYTAFLRPLDFHADTTTGSPVGARQRTLACAVARGGGMALIVRRGIAGVPGSAAAPRLSESGLWFKCRLVMRPPAG